MFYKNSKVDVIELLKIMIKPRHLTHTESIHNKDILLSYMSDNFFMDCKQTETNLFFDNLIISIYDWTSFYFIHTAIVFCLIMIPLIFLFQSSGKQRKLQKLYEKIRLQLLKLLFKCTFGILISPVLGWAFKQRGPCAYFVSSEFKYVGLDYQLPSVNIVVETIFCIFLFGKGSKKKIDKYCSLKGISKLFYMYGLKFLGILLFAFFIFYDLVYGYSNVLQIIFSLSLGTLISYSFEVMNILTSFICFGIVTISDIVFLFYHSSNSNTTTYNYYSIIFLGFGLLLFTNYLIYMFTYRRNIELTSKFSDFLEEKQSEYDSLSSIFFAEPILEEEEIPLIKPFLIHDFKDTCIALTMLFSLNVVESLVSLVTYDSSERYIY